MLDVLIVFLLIAATNGAPIIVRFLLGDKLQFPVDFNIQLPDRNPLFGKSKTWIGLLSMLVTGTVLAVLFGKGVFAGLLIGAGVAGGDLFSSFIKRRFSMQESSMCLVLDQVPESLFPCLLVKNLLDLSWSDIVVIVAGFIFFELVISRLLYHVKIRKRPY